MNKKALSQKQKALEPKEWDTLCSKHFIEECFTCWTEMCTVGFTLQGIASTQFFNRMKLLEKERRINMTDKFQMPNNYSISRSVSVLLSAYLQSALFIIVR